MNFQTPPKIPPPVMKIRLKIPSRYQSFSEPSLQPQVGMELPSSVQVYPLPETMQVQEPQRYSYTIINNAPVVVERTTRRVVHTWP